MKTTYHAFGRGVAVRWDARKEQYEVLVRGTRVYASKAAIPAYDYAEGLLADGNNCLNRCE